MSEKVFISPGKYVQGKDVVDKAGKYAKALGKSALVIADKIVWPIAGDRVVQSLEAATKEGETAHNLPFPVNAGDVLDAILAADQYSKAYKAKIER